ncbi:acyl carrier protein [Leucothrix pacifica]|uniref:Acyl carrier protein n=1 Tax=Leucothrix pacifica TaxID=1247513 RepID=A0A317C132_9GAMM|nr:acyl carrier protein [Leucothrix pacifica]PWQ92268.1 acyl carrier protein [Leucothrix pacifica]
MDNNLVAQKIRDAVQETFSLNEPVTNDNLSFKEDLSADSIDMVSLALILEEEFDGEIDDSVADQFNTVNDVINYVTETMSKNVG